MKKKRFFDEIRSYGTAILIVLVIRAFFVQAFHVPTGSMENTILVGDFLMVNRFIYGMKVPFTDKYIVHFRYPKRGEIITFRYPLGRSNFVKRCIGLPDDTVEVKHKIVYINGKRMDEPYAIHKDLREFPPIEMDKKVYQALWERRELIRYAGVRDNFGPIVVPEGTVFAMGDNRDNSDDSRFWGPLPLNLISGSPLIIYWSWRKEIPIYRFFAKVRWGRIGKIIK